MIRGDQKAGAGVVGQVAGQAPDEAAAREAATSNACDISSPARGILMMKTTPPCSATIRSCRQRIFP